MVAFWVLASCSLTKLYRRFRSGCCLHQQGALVMEASSTSETSVNFYQTKRHNNNNNPEDIFILAVVNTSNVTYNEATFKFLFRFVTGLIFTTDCRARFLQSSTTVFDAVLESSLLFQWLCVANRDPGVLTASVWARIAYSTWRIRLRICTLPVALKFPEKLSDSKMTIFGDVAPWNLVDTDIRYKVALVMKAVSTSETSVNFYQNTRCNITGDSLDSCHWDLA
jgi:hypothetical protein